MFDVDLISENVIVEKDGVKLAARNTGSTAIIQIPKSETFGLFPLDSRMKLVQERAAVVTGFRDELQRSTPPRQ